MYMKTINEICHGYIFIYKSIENSGRICMKLVIVVAPGMRSKVYLLFSMVFLLFTLIKIMQYKLYNLLRHI